MKKYYTLFVVLFVASCTTAPKVEVLNPHVNLLSKTNMQEIIIKRFYSHIHCRNADVTLLDIQPIINKGGKEIVPVIASTEFQEITGVSGWRKSRVRALYHFYKNDKNQWKVKKVKEFND